MDRFLALGIFDERASSLGDYIRLTKPKVNWLIMLTAAVGAGLAIFSGAAIFSPSAMVGGLVGIGLISAAAAVINCVIDRHRDIRMHRTRGRPIPQNRVSPAGATVFSATLFALGMFVLLLTTNLLTFLLTSLSFFGYAFGYTIYLKEKTPLNIVIGGLSGAMPPLLGWVAVSGSVGVLPLLLVLIIFVWTPPHFWALALYRMREYREANLPMLPLTHGWRCTCEQIFLYTCLLFVLSLLPIVTGLMHGITAVAAVGLGGYFVFAAYRLLQAKEDNHGRAQAFALFRFSIYYLSLLFIAMLIDGAYFGR